LVALMLAKPVLTLFEWMAGMPALGVPGDPEFRSALVAYLEWGTRLAVMNSQPGADVNSEAPMPK
jgi:hypothetical protein